MQLSFLAERPDAVKQIAQWYFDEWGSLSPTMTLEKMQASVAVKAEHTDQLPLAIVGYQDQQLIGVAELKLRENSHYPEYTHWLGGIYVHPAYRGLGYVEGLVQQARHKAVELGIDELYLQCESGNVGLYQKLGFAVLHQAKHHGAITTIMRWPVNNSF